GDLGTGRVLRFDGVAMHAATRIAGTGVMGIPVNDGTATQTPLAAPSALLYLPNGDLLIADSSAHALFALRSASGNLERFRTHVFQPGPPALAMPSADPVRVAADNQISSLTLVGGVPAAPVAIVGQPCGLTCTGANTLPAAGLAAQLNGPTGIDFDAN